MHIPQQEGLQPFDARRMTADKLPMEEDALLNIEVISILADATEKTQKPFLSRAVRFYKRVMDADDGDPEDYIKNILRNVCATFCK